MWAHTCHEVQALESLAESLDWVAEEARSNPLMVPADRMAPLDPENL